MKKLVSLVLLSACLLQARSQDIKMPLARFRTGDSLAWSQPAYDDAGWATLRTSESWDLQGYDKYDGFGWYRIHVIIPSSLRDHSLWKDSLRILLNKIDDADEVFFNGTLIGKEGAFPQDGGGYQSAWDQVREYHLGTASGLINWDGDNLIAVRVYDGNGAGGLFGGLPSVSMIDLIDAVKMTVEFDSVNQQGKWVSPVKVVNNSNQPVSGNLRVRIVDTDSSLVWKDQVRQVTIDPDKVIIGQMDLPRDRRLEVQVAFTEMNTGKSVGIRKTVPYILTPDPSPQPRINGASVVGVRPGSPFLFKIPATGQKPLRYKVENLPAGLRLDPATGILTGTLRSKGDYRLTVSVRNQLGEARRSLLIRCGNQLALTPPMGWNSWNCWGLSVNTDRVKSSAQALIDQGLIEHGWTYINIDDGWEADSRGPAGQIIPNSKFPDMKALGDWLHGHGLKFGIYSSPGPRTCGGYLGSYQHEAQDAATYASWGIDYLKYDWCSYGEIHRESDTTLASYVKPYQVMSRALRAQKRDILYSLCQYGMKDVWKWGATVDGNCWRTTGDITDTWGSLSSIGFSQTRQYAYAGPGRWNDPDMMIVGQVGWGDHLHPTRLTPDEQYTHVSLWCLLSAPLLIGCDLSHLDAFTRSLLTNDEVLAVDQDPLGRQGRQVARSDSSQIWMKPMADGSFAIGLFNTASQYQSLTVNWASIGLPAGTYRVRDLWRQRDQGAFADSFTSRVAPHGVTLLLISK